MIKTYIYYTFPSGASAGDCEYFQTKYYQQYYWHGHQFARDWLRYQQNVIQQM